MKTMRAIVVGLLLLSSNAFAWVATEGTQIMNNIELVLQYAQQVQQYQTQLQQYQTQLRNLAANPGGVQLNNLTQLASNASRLLAYGKDIATNLAQVNTLYAETYENPVAKTYADKFARWNATAGDGLKAVMLNAGLQREQFADDATALQGLVSDLAASQGNLSALQALGALNARQVQESMKLRDLIAQQQAATSNYLAAQNSQAAAKEAQLEYFTKRPDPIPVNDQKGLTLKKLKPAH